PLSGLSCLARDLASMCSHSIAEPSPLPEGNGLNQDDDEEDCSLPSGQAVELRRADVLDLHSFRPAEVADVVRDYLDAAWEKGLRELRIIHGRGIGVQREIVRKVLKRDPRVRAFHDAP